MFLIPNPLTFAEYVLCLKCSFGPRSTRITADAFLSGCSFSWTWKLNFYLPLSSPKLKTAKLVIILPRFQFRNYAGKGHGTKSISRIAAAEAFIYRLGAKLPITGAEGAVFFPRWVVNRRTTNHHLLYSSKRKKRGRERQENESFRLILWLSKGQKMKIPKLRLVNSVQKRGPEWLILADVSGYKKGKRWERLVNSVHCCISSNQRLITKYFK